MTETTVRLALAVSLSAILASCSSVHGPSARVVDGDLRTANSTVAVPRGFIDPDQIEPEAPETYTVVRGDTLWDISDRFLKEPWRWPEIWGYNPTIYDPNLIYPGDILTLTYVNGLPTLMLNRNGKSIPHNSGEPGLGAASPARLDADGNVIAGGGERIKLSPQIRSELLDSAIPTIPIESIAQFLVHPRVLDANTLASSPYVLAADDNRIISSVGNKIYARGRISRNVTNYGIYRKNKALIDPVNGANLGYEMTHVSDAKLLNIGDPSTLGLTSNKMETMAGDILLPPNADRPTYAFTPRMPTLRGEARIVSLVNAISRTGRDQVVVLNVGENANLQAGDVLAVENRGETMIDSRSTKAWEHVTLPNQRTGVLMVFQTFDKVSYALVMDSTRPLRVNDIVSGI